MRNNRGRIRRFFSLAVFLLALGLSACGRLQAPAPAVNYGASDGAGSTGIHTVLEGDTLYSIARHYRIPLQDIALANRLAAPFHLAVGQRLRLPPPRQYRVKTGDTLYSISRLFEVTTSQVAAQNNLRAPYTLYDGQILRLPAVKPPPPPVSYVARAPVDGVASAPLADGRTASAKDSAPVSSAPVRVKNVPSKITAKTPPRASSKFLKPVNGPVVSTYGPKKNGLHNDGINIQAPRGAPVRGAENGVVVYAGNELKGSGNLVLIRHEDRWMSAYAHMDKILVSRGEVIKRGQTIGTVGESGNVDSPQLHFEIRRGTDAINPQLYIE